MGVQGLWQLLESTGRPVTLESLEGKVLAVDVSIWLHQALRGMRDAQGNVPANAHLLVLFNRICKLLFYRIKPVFVFDGGVPQLKKQTMVARRQRREMAASKSKKTADKMLKNYMRTHALHAVTAGGKKSKSTSVPKLGRLAGGDADMYELPPMPASSEESQEEDDSNDTWAATQEHLAGIAPEEDVDKMDIDSEVFRALPLEIQHELISEMKEKGKKSTWKKLGQLPKQAGDFSNYQLNKLLNKGKMTQRLDELRKEMTARNTGVVASMLDFDSTQELFAGRIMSEDTEHYVLVKNKRLDKNGEQDEASTSNSDKINAIGQLKEKSQGISDRSATKVEDQTKAEVKGQNDAQCDFDLTVDDKLPASLDKSKEITEAVKSFFAKNKFGANESANLLMQGQKSESKGQMSSGSKDSDIVVVSDNDVSVSPGEVEIVESKDEVKTKNGQSLFTTAVDKFIHSALSNNEDRTSNKEESTQEKSDSSNEDDIMIVGEVAASPSTSKKARTLPPGIPPGMPKTSMAPFMSTLLDKLVASALHDNIEAEKEEVKEEVDSDESSDDDFVEVSLDPKKAPVEDELFPLETFTPSTAVCDVSSESGTSSPEPVEKAHEGAMTIEEDDKEDSDKEEIKEDASCDANVVLEEQQKEEKELEEEEEKEEKEEENEQEESSDEEESVADDDSDVAMETNDQDDNVMEDVQRAEAVEEWAGIDVANPSQVHEELESERLVLATERRKQERVALSISDVMYAESKELLQLFGLPFIVSPQEAEAQCAYLDHTEQTQGTITDDGDIWLFGGQCVYKNFFTKGKDVEFFRSGDFERQLVLNREKLIKLAYLLGSDYTEGIQGVGGVTAMEVLGEFPGNGLDGLNKLKEWWEKSHKQLMPPVESAIKSKLRKLTIYPGFPNPHVRDAYLQPVVDESKEKFTWASPDLDLLREFATDKFGWNRAKIDETLLPVLRKLNEKQVQSKINHFFPMEHAEPKKIKSTRLQRAVNKLNRPITENDNSAEEARGSSNSGRPARKRKPDVATVNDEEVEVKGQTKKTGQRSKVARINSSKDASMDSDVSEENVAAGNKSTEVKSQPARRSGRASKQVVSMEVGNASVEDEATMQTDLPKSSAKTGVNTKDTRTEGQGSNPGRGGRGKGRVGVKGKGKSLAKKGRGQTPAGRAGLRTSSGPKLSESSSDSE